MSDTDDTSTRICIKCKTGTIPTIDSNLKYTSI